MPDAFIVNCTFMPGVTKDTWPYKYGGGLGGSAAKAILDEMNPLQSELNNGVGWQDPAVITERGLCVWRSGKFPVLELKRNPDYITENIYLYWTGNQHSTIDLISKKRDYDYIRIAGRMAMWAVHDKEIDRLWESVRLTYQLQLQEGMNDLPNFGEVCKKYCGSGHGGYAFYIAPKVIDPAMIKIDLCI